MTAPRPPSGPKFSNQRPRQTKDSLGKRSAPAWPAPGPTSWTKTTSTGNIGVVDLDFAKYSFFFLLKWCLCLDVLASFRLYRRRCSQVRIHLAALLQICEIIYLNFQNNSRLIFDRSEDFNDPTETRCRFKRQ